MRTTGTWALLLTLSVACGDPGALDAMDMGPEPYALVVIEHFEWDILLVIDDSVGMSDVQAQLSTGVSSILAASSNCTGERHPWTETNVRVGFATTSVANPWCGAQLGSAGLQLQSCAERLDGFVTDEVDARDLACLDHCRLGPGELVVLPTSVPGDAARPRPWLEVIDGVANFTTPTAEPTEDALQCVVPLGIAGCAYASPLESM